MFLGEFVEILKNARKVTNIEAALLQLRIEKSC